MTTLLQIASETPVTPEAIAAMWKMVGKIGMRLLIDLITVFVLVRLIYFPLYKHRDLFFTFFIFNLIIFFLAFLLNKVDLSMGAAFGLFAVFSMLRYKTEEISIKDMTYLFLCIAIGLVSAVTKIKDAPDSLEYVLLGGINAIILIITFLLETKVLMKKEMAKLIVYENIELIQAERTEELMADIRKRTGVNVHRYSIQKIDFLKDAAQIKIYYYQ
jgi:putative flippase GtrA